MIEYYLEDEDIKFDSGTNDNPYEEQNLVYKYRTDYDHLYNVNDYTKIEEILNIMGFRSMAPLFQVERVDMESFLLLDRSAILKILKMYPMGVRLKFWKSYEKWASENDSQDLRIECSTNSLTSSTSSINKCAVDEDTFRIVMDTNEGKRFLQRYPYDDVLSMDAKRELCGLVCGYVLNKSNKLGTKEASILANSIPQHYTKEIADVYFDGKKGILYSKATNMINRWREKGIYEEPSRKKPKIESSCVFNSKRTLSLKTEELNSDVFVRSNPFASGDDFDRHWNNSRNVRMNMIHSSENPHITDILSKYKTYSRSDGFFYIISDYNALQKDDFDSNWKKLKLNLLGIIRNELKTPDIKSQFAGYEQMSDATKTVFLLYATHAFLYSSYGNKAKKQEKQSVKDSFSKLFSFIGSEGLVSQYIDNLRQEASAQKMSIQPFIIAIGTGPNNVVGTFLLCFDSHMYKIDDADTVLESLLKMYMLFNLKFPLATKNLLECLTALLFKFKYDLSSKAKSLIHSVENCAE